jgi:hypothetical protein
MNKNKYAISVVVRAIAINSRCRDASQVTKGASGLIHVRGPIKALMKKKGIPI